ncbi:MAG: FimV family protein [Rhodocyclaceae bacterium]|nr:FimV family protein [Rhodocyclaceae bacterium]
MVNSPKNFRKKALILAASLALSPAWVSAAGLGRITVQSGLGQPLRAELEVTAARDEIPSLTAKLASVDAFRIAGIEYQTALSSVQFSREVKERNGRRYIEMVSDKPINEPFVDMLIELSWSSGRLVREYTFLLDPPELVKAPPVPAMSPEIKTVERAPVMIPAMSAGKSVADAPALAVIRPAAPPMPRQTPTASADGNTHKVISGDTLGKIAAQTKPEGISLDQMLVALFQSNKEAFSGDNMNRLKAGKILTIPSADVAGKIQKAEARREIVAQAADFNVYRSKLAALAGSAPATQSGASQTSSGKIAPKVTDKVPKAVSGDKLEVSKTEGGKAGGGVDAKGKPLQGRLSSIEEDLISRDRALREANSRIGDLEKNLTDLKKLAEHKSQAGATAQKQAEATKAGTPPASPPPAAPAAVAVPANSVPPAPTDATKPDAPKAEAAKPADSAPPAKPKPVVAPPPAPEPDFMEENGMLLKGLAVLALLAGFFGFSALRKRRNVKEEVIEPMTSSSLSANSVFSDSSTLGDSTIAKATPTDYSVSQAASSAIDEPLDPIVEADTFLAFGRDAQAEERLLEGLAADPGRHAIHVKLLEIYSGRRSTLQFNTLAKDLYDQTGGSGADWERVLVMGQNLDPNNALYHTKSDEPEPAPAAVDPEATMVFSAPPAADAAEPPASGLDFDLGLDADEAAPEAESVKAEGLNIDFDLDLGGDAPSAVAAETVVDLGSDISFDLDPPSAAAPAASAVSAHASDISFDLEMPKAGGMELDLPAVEMPKAAAVGSDVDFDFDLGTVKLDAPLVQPAAAAAPLNLGGISLELDSPAAVTNGGADNPEATTKLELALAYEDMGDRDGARELLAEVLKEGSAAQQAAAQARLNQLG